MLLIHAPDVRETRTVLVYQFFMHYKSRRQDSWMRYLEPIKGENSSEMRAALVGVSSASSFNVEPKIHSSRKPVGLSSSRHGQRSRTEFYIGCQASKSSL